MTGRAFFSITGGRFVEDFKAGISFGKDDLIIPKTKEKLVNEAKKQIESYEGQSEATDKQWLFPDADFAAIARSMGAEGLTVDKPADLPGALDKAFSASGPVLVDVKSHVDAIAPLAWLP